MSAVIAGGFQKCPCGLRALRETAPPQCFECSTQNAINRMVVPSHPRVKTDWAAANAFIDRAIALDRRLKTNFTTLKRSVLAVGACADWILSREYRPCAACTEVRDEKLQVPSNGAWA